MSAKEYYLRSVSAGCSPDGKDLDDDFADGSPAHADAALSSSARVASSRHETPRNCSYSSSRGGSASSASSGLVSPAGVVSTFGNEFSCTPLAASARAASVADKSASSTSVSVSQEQYNLITGVTELAKKLFGGENVLPRNNPIRGEILALFAECLGQSTVANILGISRQHVHNKVKIADERVRSGSSELRVNSNRYQKRRSVKSDAVTEEVKQFWLDSSQQTYRRDRHSGDRLETRYHTISADDVFLLYRLYISSYRYNHYLELRRTRTRTDDSASGSDSDDGDDEMFVESRFNDENCDDFDVTTVFNLLCKNHFAVGRTKFLELKPENIEYGKMRECVCDNCRSGWRAKSRLEELERAHKWLCVDDAKSQKCAHSLDKCPQIARLAETSGEYAALSVAVSEYNVHLERVSEQHDAYIKGLASLKKNEVLLLFDFSPYKIGSNRDRTLAEAFSGVHACTSVRTWTW